MRIALAPACFPGGGGGHVVRCLALAQALEKRGAEYGFVVEPLGADILLRLGAHGAILGVDSETARLEAINFLRPDATVIDDYRLDAGFEAALRGPVLAIDDLADRQHDCALLLDAGYGRTASDYAALGPNARLLLGPEYALLRDGFCKPAREVGEEVFRVFVCFGLADPNGITARAVTLLRPLAPDAIFDVALGSDAPSLPALRQMDDPRIRLHLDADTAPLMQAADLGVGAGGGMVWERRAASLPQLVVTLAENQRPSARRLAADRVIALVDAEEPEFDARLAGAFAGLLDPAARLAQLENPAARCDGLGAARAAEALIAAI